jgi:cytochrome c-type biogenesis protein CcmH
VARELNCPLCQGYTLQDCPLPVCGQMRALIAQRLDAGESKASIKAEFVDEYGPQVLGVPPRSGAGLVAWALPGLVLVVAAGVVATLVARSTGHRRRGRPREPAVEGEYEDELERLLAEREA